MPAAQTLTPRHEAPARDYSPAIRTSSVFSGTAFARASDKASDKAFSQRSGKPMSVPTFGRMIEAEIGTDGNGADGQPGQNAWLQHCMLPHGAALAV